MILLGRLYFKVDNKKEVYKFYSPNEANILLFYDSSFTSYYAFRFLFKYQVQVYY